MAEGRVQRRLAAILAADVVGYSRLMGADEEGTLARLKELQSALIEPTTAAFNGRIFKTTGDGTLIEFPSVVDAVSCAVEIQRGMADRNSEISEDRRFDLRVGIHLGDIMVEGDDLFGDGVNVAARLEGLARAGGIALSDDAYRQVRDKLDLGWADGGEVEVKNIARPVHVWRWPDNAELGGADVSPANVLPLPDKPSIAVLPFENMSGDPEQEYFADGIVEDIITALSRISWFFVTARNSSFTYKGKAVDIRQVGLDLGVRYVLEGSVRKSGQRVRIAAQLIDAVTGNHLWAERFDRDLSDIFEVQDEITRNVVASTHTQVQLHEGSYFVNFERPSLSAS